MLVRALWGNGAYGDSVPIPVANAEPIPSAACIEISAKATEIMAKPIRLIQTPCRESKIHYILKALSEYVHGNDEPRSAKRNSPNVAISRLGKDPHFAIRGFDNFHHFLILQSENVQVGPMTQTVLSAQRTIVSTPSSL
jgi:hypothetical protein